MTAKSLPFARAASHFLVALAILVLSASNLFAGTLVGSPRDVTGANYSSPVPRVQFKPLGTPQAIGTNIYWPIEVTSTVTNGFFSAPLIQGFYWVSPVIVNPFAPTPRVLIYMPDSATNNIYQFGDCANIAAQLRTYISSNTVAFYFTNISNATGTNVTLSGTFSGLGSGMTNLSWSNITNPPAFLTAVPTAATNLFVTTNSVTNLIAAAAISPSQIVSNGTFLANGVLATNSGSAGFLTETGNRRAYSRDGLLWTNVVAKGLLSADGLASLTYSPLTGKWTLSDSSLEVLDIIYATFVEMDGGSIFLRNGTDIWDTDNYPGSSGQVLTKLNSSGVRWLSPTTNWPWSSITNPPAFLTSIPVAATNQFVTTNSVQIAFKNAINVFNLSNNFTGGLFVSGVPVLTNASVFTNGLATTNYVTSILGGSNSYTGTFSGDGSGLTNLNATNLIGTVQLSNIPTQVITNLASAVTLYGLTVSNGLKIGSSAVLTNFSGTEMDLFVGGSNNFQFFQSGNMYANKGKISATGYDTMAGTNFSVDANGNGQYGGARMTNGVMILGSGTNYNQLIGVNGLLYPTTGADNTSIGDSNFRVLGQNGGTPSYNVGVGFQNFYSNTNGDANVGLGVQNFYQVTNGYYNIGLGYQNFFQQTNTSSYNFGAGYRNFYSPSPVGFSYSTGIGRENFYLLNSGSYNTGIGYQNYYSLSTGSYNTSIGYQNFFNLRQGGVNFAVGRVNYTNMLSVGSANIVIGNNLQNPFGTNVSGTLNIGGVIFATNMWSDDAAHFGASGGYVGINTTNLVTTLSVGGSISGGANFSVDSSGNGIIGGVKLTNGVITGQLTKGIYNGGFDWSTPSGFQFSTNVNTPFGGTFGSTGYLMAQETSCRRIWPTAGTENILLTNLTLTGIYFGSTALGTTNISFTIFTNGTASSFRGALSGAYTTPGTQFSTNFTSSVLIPPNTAISLVATNESGGTVQQNIRIGISWRGIEQ